MKKLLFLPIAVLLAVMSCNSQKTVAAQEKPVITNDTIRIANDELQYEVIVIDAGFAGWFNAHAKPRSYYSQDYLEARNQVWVSEWNIRATQPQRYGDMYGMPIDYSPNVDYGLEVNYMLYYYLTYFQITNKLQLGGFRPHI